VNSSNPYTQGIAAFASQLRYEAIPEAVRQRIKLLILDTLGCAIYGVRSVWCRILIATLERLDATRTSTLWGTPQNLSAPHAALVNGTSAGGFELDDTHLRGVLHLGSGVLPAVIAAAEIQPGMSGREFIAATVAGYEIGARVGLCMGVQHRDQGWHPTATAGVFSSAAAAACALRLSESETVHALGIAGTQACGLMAAQYGAMVKRLHTGRAAQSGLYGALLAAAGFTGIVNVFESEYGGFCTTFSHSRDDFQFAELTSGLGQRFETKDVSLKFYSCAMSIHTTLDAIQNILKRAPHVAADVKRITVYCSRGTLDHVGWRYRPQGVTSAQMNLSFCVATLLITGDVSVDQFPDDSITDPARIALAEKVEIVMDPEIEKMGPAFRYRVRVRMEWKDGTALEDTVDAARGSTGKFATEAQVIEKFERLAGRALPPAQVAAIRDATLKLDECADVASLVRLLRI
jgi:2-methylcitrate dehydratase PrpD